MSERTDEQVDAALDEATIEHLDFDICQTTFAIILMTAAGPVLLSRGPKCEKPAVARLVCRTCSADLIVCDPHLKQILVDPVATHLPCNSRGLGAVVYEVRSLGGGR